MGVLVLTGIGFLTGTVSNDSIWLLETFPSLQNLRIGRYRQQRASEMKRAVAASLPFPSSLVALVGRVASR
jgi:hypothetical protein